MGLRDKFRKKHDSGDEAGAGPSAPSAPEFTFIRTDTYTQEIIHPPSAGGSRDPNAYLTPDPKPENKQRISLDVFRSGRSRSASESSNSNTNSTRVPGARRLSQRLHLSRSPASSENVPEHLPDIVVPEGAENDEDGTESQWEKRATMLARENEKNRSRPGTPVHGSAAPVIPQLRLGDTTPSDSEGPEPKGKVVSSKAIDEDIQEAIRLHEAGELERSTALFARLADPKGANNPLSQVLYGLALRYVRPNCFVGNSPAGRMGVMHLHHGRRGRVPRRDASYGRGRGHAMEELPNHGGDRTLTWWPGTDGDVNRT
jgi:hypothetical protein